MKSKSKKTYWFNLDPRKNAADWKEQFERLNRWRNRLKGENMQYIFESVANPGTEWNADMFLAFFQNCFHLKDWLRNSKVATAAELNNFIDQNIEMRLCRDLCNGSKHLLLRDPSLEHTPRFAIRVNMFAEATESRPSMIRANDHCFDIEELIDKCFSLWKQFLKGKQLIQ